jgi:APA family basic amino acid/polyamine antiporter
VLCLSGTYSDLLDFVIFAAVLFYMLTATGLFVLRRRRPEAERPVRAPLYPVLPGLYVIATALICLVLLIQKPAYSGIGLAIVVLGVPMYFLWKRREATADR